MAICKCGHSIQYHNPVTGVCESCSCKQFALLSIEISESIMEQRAVIEHYFDCPNCGTEVSDLEIGFSRKFHCPWCAVEIVIKEKMNEYMDEHELAVSKQLGRK